MRHYYFIGDGNQIAYTGIDGMPIYAQGELEAYTIALELSQKYKTNISILEDNENIEIAYMLY